MTDKLQQFVETDTVLDELTPGLGTPELDEQRRDSYQTVISSDSYSETLESINDYQQTLDGYIAETGMHLDRASLRNNHLSEPELDELYDQLWDIKLEFDSEIAPSLLEKRKTNEHSV